jgi:acid phosphatase class B
MSKNRTSDTEEPRLIKVKCWVELGGKRVEEELLMSSPVFWNGDYPELQEEQDYLRASWFLESKCKKGFSIEPISSKNASSN